MKTKAIIIGIIIIMGGVLFIYTQKEGSVACTMEAKICPDGSAVGRTGPKCEFSACPEIPDKNNTVSQVEKGTLAGKVVVGPVCPQGTPGYPCEPSKEVYAAAQVFVYKEDKKTLVTVLVPNEKGEFSTTLPVGKYFIDMIHQTVGGTFGVPTTVTITVDKITTLSLRVDTGLK